MRSVFCIRRLITTGIMLCALMAWTGASMSAAQAKNEFLVRGGEWVFLKDGVLQETPVPYASEKTGSGVIHWLLINPEQEESLKEEAPGVHFFCERTGEYSFLPLDNPDATDGFLFSREGDRFIAVEVVDEHSRRWSLYTFPDLSLQFEVKSGEYGPEWVGRSRFVYSRYESGTSRGMPEEYADEWTSLYVYDASSGEEIAVMRATDTTNYSFESMKGEGEVVCSATIGDSPEDWKDPENSLRTEEVVLPLPKAAGNEFITRDRDWYWISDGKESDAPTPNGMQETEIGWLYWLFINPDSNKALKGERKGLHLYSEYTGNYSFLPLDGVDQVNCVHFSPDGERFIIEAPAEDILIDLYTLADLKGRFSTRKGAMPPIWVDPARFVYSIYEPGTTRGAPEGYPDEWSSLVMYDVMTEEETLLKAATETSGYSMLYINEDGDIVAEESRVESPEDWSDPENKVEREYITVPVPAAG